MNKCKQCNQETNNPKFCSRSCSATYTNKNPKRKRKFKNKICKNCGKEFYVSTSGGITCSQKCNKKYRKTLFESGELKAPQSIKNFVIKRDGKCCSICGIKEWMGNPLPFILDHIDGNSENNLPNNLRLVCSNCDSQLPTYKGKNLGNGRFYRVLRKRQGKSW